MRWYTWLAVLAALPLAACLETDLTLRADGSVGGTIAWTTTSKVPEAAARALLAAENVTIKHVELKDAQIPPAKPGGAPTPGQQVTAEVDAKSLAALTAVPLLKALLVSATLGKSDAGKQTLTVRAAKSEHLGPFPATDNLVRLHFPGPVVQSSGTVSGNDVTWKVPASEFKDKPSVELTVVYAEPAAPASAEKKP